LWVRSSFPAARIPRPGFERLSVQASVSPYDLILSERKKEQPAKWSPLLISATDSRNP
jgi:hypothetical protein